jgi:hypothetical protein
MAADAPHVLVALPLQMLVADRGVVDVGSLVVQADGVNGDPDITRRAQFGHV